MFWFFYQLLINLFENIVENELQQFVSKTLLSSFIEENKKVHL